MLTVKNERSGINDLTFKERQSQIEEEKQREKEDQKRLKKSPYKDFVQFNRETYKAEDWLMSKSPIAYRILKFLIHNMDGYNSVICSYKVMQEQFNVSSDTIRIAIKLLKDKKYVDVYKTGTSNVYSINKNIVWNSWGSNFEFAKFGANIILSENEQQERVKLQIKKHNEIKIKE